MHDFPLFGGGWMLVFWTVLLIALIVLVVKVIMNSGKEHTGGTPMEILQRRYARGEIDKEEFEKRKKDLIG